MHAVPVKGRAACNRAKRLCKGGALNFEHCLRGRVDDQARNGPPGCSFPRQIGIKRQLQHCSRWNLINRFRGRGGGFKISQNGTVLIDIESVDLAGNCAAFAIGQRDPSGDGKFRPRFRPEKGRETGKRHQRYRPGYKLMACRLIEVGGFCREPSHAGQDSLIGRERGKMLKKCVRERAATTRVEMECASKDTILPISSL